MKLKADVPLTRYGLVFITVFGILTLIVFSQIMQSADETLFFTVNQVALWPPLSDLVVFGSIYGREVFWAGVLIVLWSRGGTENRTTVALLVLIFVMLVVIGAGLKVLLYRPRPYDALEGVQLLLSPLGDSSFPSGHALFVAAGAATAWIRMRRLYALSIVVEAVLVAWSRIYVGVHYPFDVVAGSFLGIGVTCVIIAHKSTIQRLFHTLARALS